MPDAPPSFRVDPDAEFADHLERVLVQRLTRPAGAAPRAVQPIPFVSGLDRARGQQGKCRGDAVVELAPTAAPPPARRAALKAALGVAAAAVFFVALAAIVRLDDEPEPADPPPTAPGPPTTAPAPPTTVPADLFTGAWYSTDPDGSSQTMQIARSDTDGFDVLIRDEAATTACRGGSSSLAGTGQLAAETSLVIATPELTCDDGTAPLLGAPSPAELANFMLDVDPATGEMVDGFGVVWRRERPDAPVLPPATVTVTVPSLGSATEGGMWPQATLDEVRAAQQLADEGDPASTWQLDPNLAYDDEPTRDQQPWTAGVVAKFLEEGLGWEEFRSLSGLVYAEGGGSYFELVFIRCAPDQTNPLSQLYAEIPPDIRTCAPTIDQFTYDTVTLDIRQPARRGPAGIWVVDEWHKLAPNPDVFVFHLVSPDWTTGQVTQVAPPSDDEVTELLDAFLRARVAGEGAEQYVLRESEEASFDDEVPLLYTTTGGAPYERFEIERGQGPVWPNGWTDYKVGLFAPDGTVIEQYFYVVSQDGRLWVVHRQWERMTMENGQPAAVPYSLLDGEVTFAAAPTWHTWGDYCSKRERSAAVGLDGHCVQHVRIAPGAPTIACQDDPAAAATAEELAASFTADPRFDATEPVQARVAGADGLQMDLTVSEGFLVCGLEPNTGRMRLILIDLPEGMSVPTLMISIVAPAEQFDEFIEDAQVIIDSIEFNPG
jgi:hypothetical protein